MDRAIFLFTFNFLYHIIYISPFKNAMSHSHDNKGDSINHQGNAVSSFWMEVASHVLVFLLLVVNYSRDNNPITYFDMLLLFLAILGTLIRYKAYYDLNQYYTFDIGIRKDHKLVTTGIYKFITHPGYLGSLLVIIPFFIFTLKGISYVLLLTHTSTIIYLFCDRIKKEEAMLLEHFGLDYKNYLINTKRFIPFVY